MFLDSNVFIHALSSRGRDAEVCARLLKRIHSGEQYACTSPLVLDEVFYVMRGRLGMGAGKGAWERILAIKNLTLLPIDSKVVAYVMPFIEGGLEPHDAFHAAVMKANGLSVICSYDKDFDKVKGIKRQAPK